MRVLIILACLSGCRTYQEIVVEDQVYIKYDSRLDSRFTNKVTL